MRDKTRARARRALPTSQASGMRDSHSVLSRLSNNFMSSSRLYTRLCDRNYRLVCLSCDLCETFSFHASSSTHFFVVTCVGCLDVSLSVVDSLSLSRSLSLVWLHTLPHRLLYYVVFGREDRSVRYRPVWQHLHTAIKSLSSTQAGHPVYRKTTLHLTAHD